MAGLLGLSSSVNRWNLNQALSSASMLEKLMQDDLRNGISCHALERVREVEQLVRRQVLERQVTVKLQLLSARLLEMCSGALNDEYARKVDYIVGSIFAQQSRKDDLYYECLRFNVRVKLNRGEIERARYFVDRIERRISVLSSTMGAAPLEKPTDNCERVTPPTWLLLGEVALAEKNYDEAERCLRRVKEAWASRQITGEEHLSYEFLRALVAIGREDLSGVAALAYLYSLHVLNQTAVGLEARSRLAAASGLVAHADGISRLEFERLRSYGPREREVIEAYLGCKELPQTHSELLSTLPETDEFCSLVDELGSQPPELSQAPALPQPQTGGSAARAGSEVPSFFSLEHKRLDSITGMFDVDGTTGPLVIDWSLCERSLITDAVASHALPELALSVTSGTIYFNEGAYVDAVFQTADVELLNLRPGDVIFELYRIAMARLPRSQAVQMADGPQALHEPVRMNVRPNKFNMEVLRRFDEANAALFGITLPEEEEETDPFENWNSLGPQPEPVAAEQRDPDLAIRVLTPFEGLFKATTLAAVGKAVNDLVEALGIAESRVEIVTNDARKNLCGEGCDNHEGLVWSGHDAGPLRLCLGLSAPKPEHQPVLRLITEAAVHRLKLMPGAAYRGCAIEVPGFIAADSLTQELLETVRVFAGMDKNFLLTGERGVGKEHIAHLLHEWSPRKNQPFILIDGGLLNNPDQLQAELYGAARGSYTGAVAERRGVVQEAEGGDLFIDEIDEGVSVQSVLKRFAQFGTYKSIGKTMELEADVRLIVATNQITNGEALIKEDLRDRFWEIRVPPLRERRADIRPLSEHFAMQFSMTLPETVLAWLETLEWPGNIRQLRNVVERACSLAETPARLTLDLVEKCVERTGGGQRMTSDDPTFVPLRDGETLGERLLVIEKQYIISAMKAAGGRKSVAARMLGYHRTALHKRLNTLFLDEEWKTQDLGAPLE